MNSVRLEVPATSANLGPGFDCLAVALELRNTLELEETTSGLTVEIEGEGADALPKDKRNLTVQAAFKAFEAMSYVPAGLHFRCVNRIPLGSGLGSSAAAIVAGLMAANQLTGGSLAQETLLESALDMEGHIDNAAAALLGGLTVVALDEDTILARRLPVADLRVAVALPHIDLPTGAMRAALPTSVGLADATFNVSHALLAVEALRTGDTALLRRAVADRLHTPHRATFIPAYDKVVAAALRAGAAAATLSGAGPGLIALTDRQEDAVLDAMLSAFQTAGVEARGWVLSVADEGARQGAS